MIQLDQVYKSFKGTPALQDLSLYAGEGEVLGLLGANGAGKSTTINLLLGFLSPDSGRVAINDLESSTHLSQVRRLIGYIPENVSLYPYLTGIENLDYFCRLAGLNYSKSELQEFLTTCGLQTEAH
ncbi:MAG: ATP-binding cassette domain-containing protein, partial [Bacteroidota bacterium]